MKGKYTYKNLLLTKYDMEVVHFLKSKIGGTLSYAMKTAMRNYAKSRGFGKEKNAEKTNTIAKCP